MSSATTRYRGFCPCYPAGTPGGRGYGVGPGRSVNGGDANGGGEVDILSELINCAALSKKLLIEYKDIRFKEMHPFFLEAMSCAIMRQNISPRRCNLPEPLWIATIEIEC